MKKDSIKRVGRSLAGAIVFFILITLGSTRCPALTFSKKDYTESIQKNNIKIDQQDTHQKTLIEANEKPTEMRTTTENSNQEFLGYFKITHYCNCSKCCGRWAGGATASGTMPEEGRTIAVDPKVIPLGSRVKIGDGDIEYIAEDTGGAIKDNKIDVFVNDHSTALQLGVLHNVPVYLVS